MAPPVDKIGRKSNKFTMRRRGFDPGSRLTFGIRVGGDALVDCATELLVKMDENLFDI